MTITDLPSILSAPLIPDAEAAALLPVDEAVHHLHLLVARARGLVERLQAGEDLELVEGCNLVRLAVAGAADVEPELHALLEELH